MKNYELYKKYLGGRHWERHPTLYAERFADFLRKRLFSGLLVDLGCGTGRDVEFFTRRGIRAMGIDTSLKEIRNAMRHHPQCSFIQGDIENLDLRDGCFSACFMINVIHYVDQTAALAEVYRTLASGGFFYIHFNLSIRDAQGHEDYSDTEEDIQQRLTGWDMIEGRKFSRNDIAPVPHTHSILELILQKR